jgi:hypothetical protein
MKYINKFNQINESNSTMPLIGFVFYFDGHFHIGSYPTFHEFAQEVVGYSSESEDDRIYLDPNYLYQDLVASYDDSEQTAIIFEGMVLWTCVKPRPTNKFYHVVSSQNPFIMGETLLKYFYDIKEIMLKYPQGNQEDPRYLSLSIENDPDLIDRYGEYDNTKPQGYEYGENMFSLKEILKGVNPQSKELKAKMVFYLRIKPML